MKTRRERDEIKRRTKQEDKNGTQMACRWDMVEMWPRKLFINNKSNNKISNFELPMRAIRGFPKSFTKSSVIANE